MNQLATSERFFAPEISVVRFALEIANILDVQRDELDAATILTDEIADMAGWTVASGTIDTPDFGKRFVRQIGGRINVEASSLTFYADREGVDVRDVLPRDTVGFMIWQDGGDVPGQPMDVFPCRVDALGKVRSVSDQASQLTGNFSITQVPAEDVEIPAFADWEATTAYDVGDKVTLTGGESLEATVAGTSDAAEPTAPAEVGGTVVDGTVTWVRIS
jgi:hypothetical protein